MHSGSASPPEILQGWVSRLFKKVWDWLRRAVCLGLRRRTLSGCKRSSRMSGTRRVTPG